jgi:hypothetical protein
VSACLDWLCLQLPNKSLPVGLREHKTKDGLKVGAVHALSSSTATADDQYESSAGDATHVAAEQAAQQAAQHRAIAAKEAAEKAATQRRADLQVQEQREKQSNAAWVQAYSKQLEDEYEEESDDRETWDGEQVLPDPSERLQALLETCAQLKQSAAEAKADGQGDRQRQLGQHISGLAAEIRECH